MNKIIYLILFILILTSCWKSDLEELWLESTSSIEKEEIVDNSIEDDINKSESNINTIVIEDNNIKEKEEIVSSLDVIEPVNVEVINEDYFINNNFSLNSLWTIKEYYLKDWNEYKTAYIEWNNILYFSINKSSNWNYLKINYPIILDVDQNLWNSIQPIFKENVDWKVIIIDLNTIKVINTTEWFNKVIWSR